MTAETVKAKNHTYCKFCKAEGVKRVATLMSKYAPRLAMRDTYKHYACEEHADRIEDTDPDRTRAQEIQNFKATQKDDDDHMTEADYQTWGRL